MARTERNTEGDGVMKKLIEKDYSDAATELGVDVASIKAITEVESNGGGFTTDGLPKILFERHVMYRLVGEKFGAAKAGVFFRSYPEVCNPSAGGYGPSSAQSARMDSAGKLIDRDCALQSSSWGLFQIMGYHWKDLGYMSLQAFVNAMYASEGAQLQAFVSFIHNDPRLLKALRGHRWAAFAEAYNGPNYAKNQYDSKLKAAYEKYGGV